MVANYSSIAHLAIAFCVSVFFWQSAPRLYLIALMSAMSIAIAVTITLAIRFKDAIPASRSATVERGQRLTIGLAFVIGSIWSTMPYVLFKDADTGHQFIVIAIAAGLVSDAFAVGPILAVSMALVIPIVVGAAVALCAIKPPYFAQISILLLIYTSFVFGSQRRLAKHAHVRIRDRLLVDEQSQTIALLLNDFEEGASDWLWETDREGRLRHTPLRMAQALGCRSEDIQREVLLEVLTKHRSGEDGATLSAIARSMAQREPFQSAIIPIQAAGLDRWWTLNGKPSFSQGGDFQGYRGVGSDVTRDHEADLRISFLATHDALTRLLNRAALQDALRVACAEAHLHEIALLYIDLDGFKAVNDRSGHGFGDILLVSVAALVVEVAPRSAKVSRLGGDEFAILLTDSDPGQTEELAA